MIGKTSSELDLRNQQAVNEFYDSEKPEVVIDAAAKVGGILANNDYPYPFLMENMQIQNNLIDGAFKSGITGRINGALISMETGPAVAFAIFNLQERGEIFIGHNTEVYKGMICGEHNRNNDLEVNFLKGKK